MRITSTSQNEVLVERVQAAGIQHGESAVVDIPNVRVFGDVLYWCEVRSLNVTAKDGAPDNRPLPRTVPVPTGMPDDLAYGYYNVRGATITPNGAVTVDVTKAQFERVR